MSIFIVLCFLVLAVGAWVFALKDTAKTQARITLRGATFRVELANTAITRMKGLSGHAPLADDEGMLFIFDSPGNHGFWMKGMTFPIDIIWIRGNTIVGFAENVPVPSGLLDMKTYYPPEPVDKVLEVNAGVVQKSGMKVGENVVQ